MTLVLQTNASIAGGIDVSLTPAQQAIKDAGATVMLIGSPSAPLSMMRTAANGIDFAEWGDRAVGDVYAPPGMRPERVVENGREFLRMGWGKAGFRPFDCGCIAPTGQPDRLDTTKHTSAALLRVPTIAQTGGNVSGGTVFSETGGPYLLFELPWGYVFPQVRLSNLGNVIVRSHSQTGLDDFKWHRIIWSVDAAAQTAYIEVDAVADYDVIAGATWPTIGTGEHSLVPQIGKYGNATGEAQGLICDLAQIFYVPGIFVSGTGNVPLLAALRSAMTAEQALLEG